MSTTTAHLRPSRFADTLGILAVVAGLILGLVPGVALASHTDYGPGGFGIDGNTVGTNDWDDFGGPIEVDEVDTKSEVDHTWFKSSMTESLYPNWEFQDKGNKPQADLENLYMHSQLSSNGAYLWLGATRTAGNGNAQVAVEFNKLLPPTEPTAHYRSEDDLYIVFNFPGSGGSGSSAVQVAISQWPAGVSSGSYGAASTLTTPTHYRYAMNADRTFIELELDLNAIFTGGLGIECSSFGGVSFRTEASSGTGTTDGDTTGGTDSSTLKDITEPVKIDLDTCANVTVEKVDEDDEPLNGVTFKVYDRGDDPETDTAAVTCVTGPDEDDFDDPNTDADGECSFGPLQPGDYTLYETDWPTGYRISPEIGTDGYDFTVEPNVPKALGPFTDPRIPYTIAVTPETATNALNETNADASLHKFTVTLTGDGSPLEGETVGLSWSGGVGAIVKVDDSTTVLDECTTDAAGTCDVWVNTTAPGGGTLTASWDTPYQNTVSSPSPLPSTTATGGTPPTTAYPTIADSGDKDWVGLGASIAADGLNLLGDPHDFTVSVWEVDGEGADDGTEAGSEVSGVTVSVSWDGPTGSVIANNASFTSPSSLSTTCTTGSDGTCKVWVDSDTNAGTGTAEVTSVSGTVTGGETAVTTFDADEVTADKTWREYAAFIDSNSTNPAGQSHSFNVTVKYRDDAATSWDDASLAPDGTTVEYSLSGDGVLVDDDQVDPAITGSTCDDGTSGGTCTIVVYSASPGLGTVTVKTVNGDLLDDGGETADGPYDVTDVQASKTWLDFVVNISDPAVNQVGESHTFRVDASYSDDGQNYDPVPVGTKLTWTDSTDLRVTADSCSKGTGTGDDPDTDPTETNVCFITVNSSTPGKFDVEVTGVDDFQFTGRIEDVDFNESAQSSKTWIAYRASIASDGLNLVRDDHPFTVTVEQNTGDGSGWVAVPNTTTVTLTSAGLSTVGESCETTSGQCTVTVNSNVAGFQTLTVATVETLDAVDSEFTTIDVSSGADLDEGQEVSATKVWVAFRASIDQDSVNITGDDHNFLVNAEYTTDGSTWSQVPDGSSVTVSDNSADAESVGSIDSDTCGSTTAVSGDAELDDHVCVVTVRSLESGSLEVYVDGLSATITANGITDTFPVTFGSGNDGVMTFTAGDYTATKTWASYQLRLDPETATNLLDGSTNDPEKDHVITATLTSDDDSLAPVVGQEIRFDIDDGASITDTDGGEIFTEPATDGADATCVTVGDDPETDADETGTCTITISRDTPGQAIVDAWYSATVGDSAAQTIDSDNTATKTWTTFRLTVTPDNAVNLVGNPHNFTVTLWESILTADCGEAAVEGFCLVETDDPIEISVPGDTTEDDLTVNTTDCDDGTNAQGQCVVTVTSGSVRAITLTATYLESYADYDTEITGKTDAVFSDSGDKSWIDYDIDVDPDTDQNLVNTDHTFTVTVTTTVPGGEGGTTTMGVVGATPDVFLSGPGTITGNTCDAPDGTVDDNPGTEDVDETGTCTVTITSGVPGLSTLDASYLGIASGVDPEDSSDDETRTYDTRETEEDDSGDKLWVDYLLELTPNAVNTVGDPHAFTATLRRSDDGALDEDYLPVVGATLAWTVDGVGGRVEGAGDVGEDLTCVTDAAGTCDLVINSAEAGATDVSVSYGAVVGATSRTDTENRTKQWVDIELVKTAVTGDGFSDGDLIADPGGFPFLAFTSSDQGPKTAVYEYTITNPSNVTLENVVLTDDRLGPITLSDECQTLDPGEVCTGVRDSEQFDYFDATASLASLITNVGTVTATGGGEEVSDTDDATITLVAVQSSILIDLVKDVVAGAGDVTDVGGLPIVNWSEAEYEAGVSKTVRYRFTVTNISNSPIIDVELVDPMVSDEPIIAKADGVTLQPGESRVVEVDHLLTVGEAFPDGPIASKVDNVATVSGASETRDSFSSDTDDASVFSEIVFAEVLEKEDPQPAPAVEADAEDLPATGLDADGLVPLAVLLMLVGSAILWLDRRWIGVR